MREYVKPMMDSEVFVANEYVSACADSATYSFRCNAPAGTLYYYPKSDGKIDGVYEGYDSAEKMGSYHPCSATHIAPTTDVFYDGFVDRNSNRRQDPGEGVIVWRNREWSILGWRWNGHATTDLDMNKWKNHS